MLIKIDAPNTTVAVATKITIILQQDVLILVYIGNIVSNCGNLKRITSWASSMNIHGKERFAWIDRSKTLQWQVNRANWTGRLYLGPRKCCIRMHA